MRFSTDNFGPLIVVITAVGSFMPGVLSLYFPLEPLAITIFLKATLVLMCVIMCVNTFTIRPRDLSNLNILLFVFLLLYCFRVLADTLLFDVLTRHPAEDYLFYTFIGLVIPVVAVTLLQRISLQLAFKNALLLFSLMAVLLSLKLSELVGESIRNVVVSDRIIGPLLIGYLGSYTFILAAVGLGQKNKNLFYRCVLILIALIGILLIGLSGSRGPLVAAIIPICLLAVKNIIFDKSLRSMIVTAILGSAIVILVTSTSILEGVMSRLLKTGERLDYGGEARGTIAQSATETISENIFFGYSLELPAGNAPHNIILEAFLATGVIGGIIMSVLFGYGVFRSASNIFRSEFEWVGYIHLASSVFVMVSGTIFYSGFYFVTLAILFKPKPCIYEGVTGTSFYYSERSERYASS